VQCFLALTRNNVLTWVGSMLQFQQAVREQRLIVAQGLADPTNVNLNTASQRDVFCYMEASKNAYDGDLGARISSVFVILVISSAVTFFPVLSTRVPKLKIPIYAYLFARYFGSGVIVATGFVQYVS